MHWLVAVALAVAGALGWSIWRAAERRPAGRDLGLMRSARGWALADTLAAPLATAARPSARAVRLAAVEVPPTGSLRVGLFRPRSRGDRAALAAATALLKRA